MWEVIKAGKVYATRDNYEDAKLLADVIGGFIRKAKGGR